MKQILVIFTGGTIGSRKKDNQIDVVGETAYFLLSKYKESVERKDVHFHTKKPYTILSENLMPRDWMQLKDCLQASSFADYDGIIITHGSDTLAYTSVAMSYMFSHTSIPIILTASNFPLDDSRSNGLRNFISAVDFIYDNPTSGVFAVFEDRYGESLVHIGSRLMQALPFTDEFESTNSVPFGKMVEGKFVRTEHPYNITVQEIQKHVKEKPSLPLDQLSFSEDILHIKPYPGIGYHYYDFTRRKPKAVLHDLFHSGTASAREETESHFSIRDFMAYCQQNEVDFYIAPMKNIKSSLYTSSHKLMEFGATPLVNISIEAALVKLMLAYGTWNEKEQIKSFLLGPALFFEESVMQDL